MSQTSKKFSERDMQQAIRGSFNDVDKSLTTNGFLVGKVGHQITYAITTTTISGDTEVYSFLDNSTLLYTITIVYTDATRSTMISATRTA
jgi:hypothetical protein